MNETFIKNKGITQTFIQDNNHKHINKSSWDAEYDGNAANISVDLNDNGHKKHYDIQLDNDDLANILNIKGVDTDLDKRLINDYKKRNINKPIYEKNILPLSLPLMISNEKHTKKRYKHYTKNKRYKNYTKHKMYNIYSKKPKTRKLYRYR